MIGAGLAGTEAAWQVAQAGIRSPGGNAAAAPPSRTTAANLRAGLRNSFGALSSDRAAGLLQEELRRLGSLVIGTADHHAVPAGGSAVDRGRYSAALTAALDAHPLVRSSGVSSSGAGSRSNHRAATGPLTSEPLAEDLRAFTGRRLPFF